MRSDKVVSLCSCLFLMYQEALRAILRNLFCVVCDLFIFIRDAATVHTGLAHVISGLILLMNTVEVSIKL